jgi:methionyl-tRNA synthetase
LKQLQEKNWFFALSHYQQFLEDFFAHNNNFVVPQSRYNEMKSFMSQ